MADLRIETERLVLREWELSDLSAVQEYASDPVSVQFMIWGPNSEEETQQFLQEAQAWRVATPRTRWEMAVTLRGEERVIGGCGLTADPKVPGETQLGYILNKRFWKLGYGTEAAAALVDWGRRELGLKAVWCTCHAENRPSYRLMEKLGMKRVALWPKHIQLRNGVWRDTLVYRLTF